MNKVLQSIFYKPMYLTPAYGRRYAGEATCLKDWQAGKSFKLLQGAYCSIRDYDELSIDGPVFIVISDRQHVEVTGCNK